MIADLVTPAPRPLTPEDIAREVKNLPSAPRVLPKLKQLLCDGNSAMHDIVSLVRIDPGIAARVLQVANSAYFSKGMRCLTVSEAVNRVGYDQIYELVAYAVASQVLARPLEVYRLESDLLWKMSVAGALAAEGIADRTGQDRSVAYTIGLLHCVGMVAIDEWALRNRRGLVLTIESFPREATESERAELGFTQAEAGGALLGDWGFPESIIEPVRWQYAPSGAGGQLRMTALLAAAKWVRNAACGQVPTLPTLAQLHPLGLTPAALKALAGEVAGRLAEVNLLLEDDTRRVPERPRFPR